MIHCVRIEVDRRGRSGQTCARRSSVRLFAGGGRVSLFEAVGVWDQRPARERERERVCMCVYRSLVLYDSLLSSVFLPFFLVFSFDSRESSQASETTGVKRAISASDQH